jgi:lactate dehydrogenase-like 2-hydroxyacid dehydrogenase
MTTARPALLQLIPLNLPEAPERLATHFDVVERWTAQDREAAMDSRRDDVTVLVTSATTATPAALIDRFPALKAICSFGVGYDSIDVRHAQQKGIQVSNTPDVLNDCVADHAMGLLLATARRLGQAERYARADQWGSRNPFPLGTKVSGKKLGIVGLGRIGMAIARRAAGFDMEIRYHNRNPRKDTELAYEPSLHELANWADFLVIATVGGPDTQHLIDERIIRALGPQGILVNIARGSVIDEEAMVKALEDGGLGGAGLDVYAHEPRIPEALKTMDNVVIVPHIASATQETRRAMIELVLDNVDAYATRGQVLTPIAPLA